MGGVSFNGLAPMCAIVRSLLFALLVSAFSFHVRAEALTTDWDSLRAGAVIVPTVMTLYSKPKGIEDMIDSLVGKALDLLGIDNDIYARWG